MPPLDELAARAETRARLLAMAVHDAGPWFASWGDELVLARREPDPQGGAVRFVADFERLGAGPAALRCRDETVSWMDVEVEGDFLPGDVVQVVWVLGYAQPVAA